MSDFVFGVAENVSSNQKSRQLLPESEEGLTRLTVGCKENRCQEVQISAFLLSSVATSFIHIRA